MEKKITKKEYYAMLKEIVEESKDIETEISKEELLEFINKQVASIETKAEKAKEKAAEKKANGDELREVVQSVLTDEYQTIDTILSQIEGEDINWDKHYRGDEVKAITFHKMNIVEGNAVKLSAIVDL